MGSAYRTEVNRLIAQRSGSSYRTVACVLNTFYEFLREELVQAGAVTIPEVGTLRRYIATVNRDVMLTQYASGKKPTRIRVQKHVRIYFTKAAHLKSALKEEMQSWTNSE